MVKEGGNPLHVPKIEIDLILQIAVCWNNHFYQADKDHGYQVSYLEMNCHCPYLGGVGEDLQWRIAYLWLFPLTMGVPLLEEVGDHPPSG